MAIHTLRVADGTRLAWHTHGSEEAARTAAPIVLTNGLGTTSAFWNPLANALGERHRVVHWDYRGHGDSEVSRSGDYAIKTQARDLVAITQEAIGGPAVHVGFSMGVTVVLELYRRRPDLVRALVLIAGGADHPYATSLALRLPGTKAALRAWLAMAAPVVPHLRPFTRRLSESSIVYPIGRAIGALSADAPRQELENFFRAVGSMEPAAYWATLRALIDSHAADVLPTVRVPALVIAPDHDVMAPRRDLEQLRDTIPGAKWLHVPGTSHAILLEAGKPIARAVGDFLAGLG